uniref:Protein kinase domain-containing protein n=1 Tax=Compsopogon caeruleus TaxID=31354 RepID=A0A7S1T8Y2_9RHOD|mmetsp:Transcript_12928/g.26207  ORF Transcript_12928/g.26207 Transcript_12928/m.26207 type:complete len:502 (+) Transcript_12928:538-2043(+)
MTAVTTKRHMRHGEPARAAGIIRTRLKPLGRWALYYVSLKGPLITFSDDEQSVPFLEVDILDWRVTSTSRKGCFVVKVSHLAHCISLYFVDEAAFKFWVPSLENATSRKIDDHYRSIRIIARGESSSVIEGEDMETGAKVAIKVIDRDMCSPALFAFVENEVQILAHVNHPQIINLADVYETPRFLFLVMGYAAGGDLETLLESRSTFTHKEIYLILRQILRALDYLHQRDFVHRDVKPGNVLLDSTEPLICRLADLGFAACLKTKILNAVLGTVQFMAPEMVKKESYGCTVDIWAVGVIAFRLLLGRFPFEGSESDILRRIRGGIGNIFDDDLSRLPKAAQSFIRSLLQVDPEKRLTALGALHHRFLYKPAVEPYSFRFRAVALAVVMAVKLGMLYRNESHQKQDLADVEGYSEFSVTTSRVFTPRKVRRSSMSSKLFVESLDACPRHYSSVSATELTRPSHDNPGRSTDLLMGAGRRELRSSWDRAFVFRRRRSNRSIG